MEGLSQQVALVSDEVATLKNELIALKGAHAALHQSAAEAGQSNVRNLGDQSSRIDRIEKNVDEIKGAAERGGISGKPKSLMEAKQVQVEKCQDTFETKEVCNEVVDQVCQDDPDFQSILSNRMQA